MTPGFCIYENKLKYSNYNPRTTEWMSLEGASEDHLVQPSSLKQGWLDGLVAEVFVQSD